MAKYELSLTSGNVFSTPVTLTVTPSTGPSVTVSGSSAISTPVELAVLNSIGPRGETGPQGPQGPQGIQGSPGDSVNVQIFDGNIAVGQSVLTTDDVTFNSVTTTGNLTVGGTITGAVNGPFVGDVTVEAGDTLDVSAGTLTLADDQISGDKVEGGTIGATTINTLTATTINVSGNVDGRDLSVDGAKLDGIEVGATADQTDAEIKTAYENNADTNAFTDADHSKLDGIEANATADQTDAEIKTAYENNANTNAFTDADNAKLGGIEAGATADQTGAEIKALYEAESNTNAFTDADHSKLDGIETGADVTDTANVTAAGALMDSEVTNLVAVKALDQGVSTTDDVTFDDVTLTGQLKGPATFTIDPAAHGDDTGTVVVAGNLQVDGTTTTINSTIVEIDDLNLKLAAEATTNAQANGAGITVGDGLANITYNSGTDRWVLDKELSADVVGTVSGDVTGNVTGNLTGNVTGTVSTLTNHDTDDLAEGTTNLYYTSARANTDFDTRLATKTTSDLAEGTNLYYTAARFDTAFGAKDTDSLSEGLTNLYYTDGRAQAAISTDSTLSYSSGVVSMPNTGVTAATYGSASQVPVIAVDAQGRITSASQTNVAGVTDFDYNTLTGVLDIDTADGDNFAATVTLDPFDTDNLSEGSTNQYYTDDRSRAAISVTDTGGDGSLAYNSTTGVITFTGPSAAEVRAHLSAGGDLSYDSNTGIISFTERTDAEVRQLLSVSGDLSYNSTTGVFSFTERTDAEVRGLVSATDAGGDGSFSYNSTTGVFTYTGPSASEVRAHLSAGGDLSYDSATGVISFTERTDAEVRQLLSVSGDLSYDNTTGVFSFTERTDAEVRGLFSVAGDLSYNSTTGEFSFTERTDAEVRGLVSASGDLSYNSTTGVFSFTERTDSEVRGLVSATDAGGDGSFSYDSATGVFTYTGPSASEVRNHFTGGTGVTITNGDIAIGQEVGTGDSPQFVDLTLSGDLTVNGSTTTIDTTNLAVEDSLIELSSGLTAAAGNDAGLIIERGTTGDNAFIGWDEAADKFTLGTTTATGISTGSLTVTTGTLVADIEGDVTGNSDTASALATPRTIALSGDVTGSASFDGSANITINTTVADDSHSHVIDDIDNLQTSLDAKVTTVGTPVDNQIGVWTGDGTLEGDANFTWNGSVFDVNGQVVIDYSSTTSPALQLVSSDTSSSASPEFELYKNSSGPADGDYLGQIKFAGENSSGGKKNFGKITGKVSDVTAGTEDGLFEFAVMKDGSLTIVSRLTHDALKLINGTGLEVAGDATISGALSAAGTITADTFSFANWTVTESGGSLYFATGGTNKMKLDASGNLQVVGNVESNATIS